MKPEKMFANHTISKRLTSNTTEPEFVRAKTPNNSIWKIGKDLKSPFSKMTYRCNNVLKDTQCH